MCTWIIHIVCVLARKSSAQFQTVKRGVDEGNVALII
jgi:hypothetical protein